jgi:hypothetical protein
MNGVPGPRRRGARPRARQARGTRDNAGRVGSLAEDGDHDPEYEHYQENKTEDQEVNLPDHLTHARRDAATELFKLRVNKRERERAPA